MVPTTTSERLNAALDHGRALVLVEKEGERIEVPQETAIVGGMNPATSDYAGRCKLSKALHNRFTFIAVPEMSEQEEKQILGALAEKRGLPKELGESLVRLQHWVIDAYARGVIGQELADAERPELSIRSLLDALDVISGVLRTEAQVDFADAYMRAVDLCWAAPLAERDAELVRRRAEEVAA
jgi:midasin (ATPase involved in ribosome maturation)